MSQQQQKTPRQNQDKSFEETYLMPSKSDYSQIQGISTSETKDIEALQAKLEERRRRLNEMNSKIDLNTSGFKSESVIGGESEDQAASFEKLKREQIEKQRKEKLAMIRREREQQGKSIMTSTNTLSLPERKDEKDESIPQTAVKSQQVTDRQHDREIKLISAGLRVGESFKENIAANLGSPESLWVDTGASKQIVQSNDQQRHQPTLDSPNKGYSNYQSVHKEPQSSMASQTNSSRLNSATIPTSISQSSASNTKVPNTIPAQRLNESTTSRGNARSKTPTSIRGSAMNKDSSNNKLNRSNLELNNSYTSVDKHSRTPKGTSSKSFNADNSEIYLQEKFHKRFYQRENAYHLLQEKVVEDIKALANSKKMSENSYRIMTQRLEKTLALALLETDKDNSKKLTFEQIGRLFTLLGIFRVIQYGEDLELENEEQFFSNATADQARRNGEMMLHEQIWMLLSGYKEVEKVDAEFAYIIFRLLMDPANLTIDETGKMLDDYIQQYKETVQELESPDANQSAKESPGLEESELQPWSSKELVKQFRKISENRLAYTKIGFLKGEKEVQDERNKNLTFKPKINPTSKAIEAVHTQKFIKEHKVTPKSKSQNQSKPVDQINNLIEQIRDIERNHKNESTNGLESVVEKDNETDMSYSSKREPDRIDILYKHHELYQKSQEERRKIRQKELTKECTFQPHINSYSHNKPGSRTRDQLFNKLYNYSKEQKRKEEELQFEQMERDTKELEECSFRPQIQQLPGHIYNSKSVPKGYEKSIGRLRYAHEEHTRKKEALEKIPTGENYEKLKTQPVKQFSFLDESNRPKKRTPFVYLDINVGPGKTGRIGIHEDDDPSELAHNFALTFQLSQEMYNSLEEMISEQLNQYFNEKLQEQH